MKEFERKMNVIVYEELKVIYGKMTMILEELKAIQGTITFIYGVMTHNLWEN